MTQTPGESAPEPYEPHHLNMVRDRKKLRAQYGPYSYTKGMYVNGSKIPMKPRNIRIESSIPIVMAVGVVVSAIWMLATGRDPWGAVLLFVFAGVMLLLSWVGFRTARLRAQWERENPELAKKIDY